MLAGRLGIYSGPRSGREEGWKECGPPLSPFPEPEATEEGGGGEMPSAALANYYRRRRRRDLNTDGVDLFCFTVPVTVARSAK